MADTLRLEIITPLEIAFAEDVHMVTLPGVEGEMGIYPHHMRLITQIVPGEIIVNKDGQDRSLAVGEGLVDISATRDEAKLEEARQRAEARLREKISDEEVATVNASLARALAQLQVKRRRRV